MKKKLYMGTNTKMYKTAEETEKYIRELAELTEDISPDILQRFVIPSFTSLDKAVKASKGFIQIGAQNVGWEESGQFTGEISPVMLQEQGVDLVMIGHSERRHIFHETDFEEEKKVTCALQHGFTVLLCIGETALQQEYHISCEVLAEQLKIGLKHAPPERAKSKLWIAYEPVWAIGVNGTPAEPSYVEEIHQSVKNVLTGLFGSEIASQIPVLYGGSVSNENAVELIRLPAVDGLFVGRSAWDAENFNKIIRKSLPVFMQKAQSAI